MCDEIEALLEYLSPLLQSWQKLQVSLLFGNTQPCQTVVHVQEIFLASPGSLTSLTSTINTPN
jgi:hypothetical protein